VLGLYSLDSRLTAARTHLASLQAQAQTLRRQRAVLARELQVAKAGVAISQRRLASRLRLLYEQGDVTAFEVLLGSKTLDDALTGLENLDRVASLDRDVLTQVRTAKGRVTAASAALAVRAERLAAATRAAEATAASLERAKAERTAYIAGLAEQRRLNSAEIGRLEEQARAAELRTQRLLHSVPDATVATPAAPDASTLTAPAAPAAGGRTIIVSATGYALSGATATGLPVGWGVAAVDPGVIPLGTHMTIPGYGEAVAADTGGAIVGATIDLWFPTVAQAQAWGRRTITIVLH
jgi:cystine transport system substrate-binding protein